MHNRQDIIGHLAADAVIRQVGDNRKVVNFRIGSTYAYLSKGQEVSHTEWFNIEVFVSDRQSEFFSNHFVKGAMVHASGRTQTETYRGNDGQDHSKPVVKCDVENVQFLRAPNQRTQQSTTTRTATPASSSNQRQPLEAPAGVNRGDLMNFDD